MMNKSKIFQIYINAWLNKDNDGFLGVLSERILITECYGAQYKGKSECAQWFSHWNTSAYNLVKSWRITGQQFEGEISFFTWTFECIYEEKLEIFDGCSLVKFDGNLISEIQEFQMKHEKFRPYQEK